MPRRSRPRSDRRPPHPARPAPAPPPLRGGWVREEGGFMVRSISGKAATKTYRCPGCHHEIPPGTPHVVAWAAGGAERSSSWGAEDLNSDDEPERRHWHTGCWRRRRA